MRIVLDTNLLLVTVSRKSSRHWLYAAFEAGVYQLAFTGEILAEYEEQLFNHWNQLVAEDIVRTMIELPNGIPVTIFYRLNLIQSDKDDNKFVDCAFASNANYIVTEDHHFNVLRQISFPKIPVVNSNEFRTILIQNNLL
jgi:putative PIN family toxin of toxin-antitoxin system